MGVITSSFLHRFYFFFFKHYLCSKRNISIWVLITYHPYICPIMEKTITVYIINMLLRNSKAPCAFFGLSLLCFCFGLRLGDSYATRTFTSFYEWATLLRHIPICNNLVYKWFCCEERPVMNKRACNLKYYSWMLFDM